LDAPLSEHLTCAKFNVQLPSKSTGALDLEELLPHGLHRFPDGAFLGKQHYARILKVWNSLTKLEYDVTRDLDEVSESLVRNFPKSLAKLTLVHPIADCDFSFLSSAPNLTELRTTFISEDQMRHVPQTVTTLRILANKGILESEEATDGNRNEDDGNVDVRVVGDASALVARPPRSGESNPLLERIRASWMTHLHELHAITTLVIYCSCIQSVECIASGCLPKNLTSLDLFSVPHCFLTDPQFGLNWPETILSLDISMSNDDADGDARRLNTTRQVSDLSALKRLLSTRLTRLRLLNIWNVGLLMDEENCFFGDLSRSLERLAVGLNGYEPGALSLLPRGLRSLSVFSNIAIDEKEPEEPLRFSNRHLEGIPEHLELLAWSSYVGDMNPALFDIIPPNIADISFYVGADHSAAFKPKRAEYFRRPQWEGLKPSMMTAPDD